MLTDTIRSWLWIIVIVATMMEPRASAQQSDEVKSAEQEARTAALEQAREELARAQEVLAAAEAAAAAGQQRLDHDRAKAEAAARQAELISKELEQQSQQWATRNSARWEAWADGQAQRWEQWAQQYERHWKDWAAGHEAQWEEWAQRYEAQWNDWGHQLESGKIHPDQLREMYRGNLEMLGEMPIQELYQGILENAAELEDAPWEEVAGSIQELVRESIESAMKGLEATTFDAERGEAQVVDRIRAMQESLQQLKSNLGATQLELDAAARKQLQELKEQLNALEKADGKAESARMLRIANDAARQERDQAAANKELRLAELALAAKLKQESLRRQSEEIEALREEIRELRREIDEQRTKEEPHQP